MSCTSRSAPSPVTASMRLAPAPTDLLADIQHRRCVLFTLANDDHTVHLDHFEAVAHGVDGSLVERILIAATHPARSSQRRGFGHAAQLHGDVAIQSTARRQAGLGEILWRGRHGNQALLSIEAFQKRPVACVIARTWRRDPGYQGSRTATY